MQDRAVAVVEGLHAALLDAMQAQDLDTAGRAARLRPVIENSFDVAGIVRLSLGRIWQELPSEEREQLEAAQFELILSTYAYRFADYDGERFVTLGPGQAPGSRLLLRTRIEPAAGRPVQLDYLLHDTDTGPRILNVIADGYSELSTRRAEYTAIHRRGGTEALLAELERLIAGNLGRNR